jgi:hypothetical protein
MIYYAMLLASSSRGNCATQGLDAKDSEVAQDDEQDHAHKDNQKGYSDSGNSAECGAILLILLVTTVYILVAS